MMRPILLGAALIALAAPMALAQDTAQDPAQDPAQAGKKWEFLVEPYFMLANMEGTTAVGSLPDVEVDASAEEILDHLQSGFMIYVEARKGPWAFTSDFLFMDLEASAEPSTAIQSGVVTMGEAAWELAGLRKILPWLEGGVAARMMRLEMGLDVVRNQVGGGTTEQSKSLTQTWVDPAIVARMQLPDADKWLLQLRGDIGGFGIGSDLAWQVQAYGGYRFSHLFQVTAGYRAFGIDYETGEAESYFLYDVVASGPVLQVGFNF
jgi:hypothetical protein